MWFKIAFLCLVVGQLSVLSHFELQPSKEYAHDIDINLYEDNTRIGFISYTKVFLFLFILSIICMYILSIDGKDMVKSCCCIRVIL